MKTKGKLKIHRAWIVLLGCMMTQSATSGIVNNIGQFYRPVAAAFSTAENTIGISDVALGRTMQMISGALFLFFIGSKLLDKYYRRTLFICSAVYSIHYIVLSFCNNLIQLYAVQCILGCAVSVLQTQCVITTINRWFVKKKGLAVSISTAAAGLSSIIFSPVAGNIIEYKGWRAGFLFFGIASMILTLAGTMIFMKESPEKYGLKPYGWEEAALSENKAKPSALIQEKHISIYRRPELYLIIIIQSTFSFLMTSTAHTASYASSIGYSIVAASYISSIGLAGNTSMKLAVGALRDRLGTAKAALIEFCAAASGYLLLILNIGIIPLYIGIFLVGSVMSCSTVIAPVLQTDFFKGKDFVKALPLAGMVGNFVGAFANYFYGWVCDKTGSYTGIFYICLALIAIDTFLMIALEKIRRKRQPLQ